MARQIVTSLLVAEVIKELIAEGTEPTLLNVQSRIGGGSYSTVKRFLDEWKEARSKGNTTAYADIPTEIQANGQEFICTVWDLSIRHSRLEVQQVKDAAHAEVARLGQELTGATEEIVRLEKVENGLEAKLTQQQSQWKEAERALMEAQNQARRVPELENLITELHKELELARKEATDKAVAIGKLSGETEVLRQQLHELMALFTKLSSMSPDP